jgi:hypothetical protein
MAALAAPAVILGVVEGQVELVTSATRALRAAAPILMAAAAVVRPGEATAVPGATAATLGLGRNPAVPAAPAAWELVLTGRMGQLPHTISQIAVQLGAEVGAAETMAMAPGRPAFRMGPR